MQRPARRCTVLPALFVLAAAALLGGCSRAFVSASGPGSGHGALPGSTTPLPLRPVTASPHPRTPSASPTRSVHPVGPRARPAWQVGQVPGVRPRGKAKAVALTFDDGPSPYTGRVLTVLRRTHVPATFFELGVQVKLYPKVSRSLAKAGMSVQSHTWDHRDLERLGTHAVDRELSRSARIIQAHTGRRPTCLRPPYGAVDRRVNKRIAKAGEVPVTWDVDTEDWKKLGANRVVHRALATVHPDAIILMHDGGGNRSQTVAALPRIIHRLRARGYHFVSLCHHP